MRGVDFLALFGFGIGGYLALTEQNWSELFWVVMAAAWWALYITLRNEVGA